MCRVVHAIALKLISQIYRYEMDRMDNVFLRGNAGSRGQTGIATTGSLSHASAA